MQNLKSFRFEIWTDGKYDMCSIRANRDQAETGLRWIWFVLDRRDFEAIVAGKATTAEDGYHKLNIWGDMWTFYDLEMPRDASGVMPGGQSFKTLPEFKRILAHEKAKFYRGFTEKLLAYALGRPVGAADRELVNGILSAAAREEYRLQAMVQAIVATRAFQTK